MHSVQIELCPHAGHYHCDEVGSRNVRYRMSLTEHEVQNEMVNEEVNEVLMKVLNEIINEVVNEV